MTESRTARLSLPQWSDGAADAPSRADFNEAFLNLENNAAMFAQGTLAARPAAGKQGRFYTVNGDGTASNNGFVYYDTGTSWIGVGGNLIGNTIKALAANAKALVVQGFAGQSTNIMEWQDSAGNVLAYVDKTGLFRSAGLLVNGVTTMLGAVTMSSTLNVGAKSSLKDTDVLGVLTATTYQSTANRADGTPLTKINADGTGWMDAILPVGTILPTARATAPAGFLMCQGQSLSRATYPDLYAAIGTTYGSASGTTFSLPDLRNRNPRGAGNGTALGETGGVSHTHSHTHSIAAATVTVGPFTMNSKTTGITMAQAGTHNHVGPTDVQGAHQHTVSVSEDGAHDHGGTTGGPSGTTDRASGTFQAANATHTHSISTAGTHSHTAMAMMDGDHNHTFLTSSDGLHTHALTDPGHTHTISGVTSVSHDHGAATGATDTGAHPYIGINYMIRT